MHLPYKRLKEHSTHCQVTISTVFNVRRMGRVITRMNKREVGYVPTVVKRMDDGKEEG